LADPKERAVSKHNHVTGLGADAYWILIILILPLSCEICIHITVECEDGRGWQQ